MHIKLLIVLVPSWLLCPWRCTQCDRQSSSVLGIVSSLAATCHTRAVVQEWDSPPSCLAEEQQRLWDVRPTRRLSHRWPDIHWPKDDGEQSIQCLKARFRIHHAWCCPPTIDRECKRCCSPCRIQPHHLNKNHIWDSLFFIGVYYLYIASLLTSIALSHQSPKRNEAIWKWLPRFIQSHVSVYLDIFPVSIHRSYLLIYRFHRSSVLNTSLQQVDRWLSVFVSWIQLPYFIRVPIYRPITRLHNVSLLIGAELFDQAGLPFLTLHWLDSVCFSNQWRS